MSQCSQSAPSKQCQILQDPIVLRDRRNIFRHIKQNFLNKHTHTQPLARPRKTLNTTKDNDFPLLGTEICNGMHAPGHFWKGWVECRSCSLPKMWRRPEDEKLKQEDKCRLKFYHTFILPWHHKPVVVGGGDWPSFSPGKFLVEIAVGWFTCSRGVLRFLA